MVDVDETLSEEDGAKDGVEVVMVEGEVREVAVVKLWTEEEAKDRVVA